MNKDRDCPVVLIGTYPFGRTGRKPLDILEGIWMAVRQL